MKFSYASLVTGCGRVCEDRAGALETADFLLLYVADGAGGVSGGAKASERFAAIVRDFGKAGGPPNDWLQLAFLDADVELRTKAIGETTAVVATVSSSGIVGASAGDSEAWIVRGDRIDDLTHAQSREHLGRPSIFGGTPCDFTRASLDGTLVLATDGLFKYVARDAICRLAELPPEEACRALTDAARLPNGALQDDVGVVVARVLGTRT